MNKVEASKFVERLKEFESPEELAAHLAVLGFRGHRHVCEECPLARVSGFGVASDAVEVLDDSEGRWLSFEWGLLSDPPLPIPNVAIDFINKFDNEVFPELVEE